MRRKEPSIRRTYRCPFCEGYYSYQGLHSHFCRLQPCATCGRICFDEERRGGYEKGLCESCYWGMRLMPDLWAEALKTQGLELTHRGGCVVGDNIAVCRDAYTGRFGCREEA